MTPRLIDSIRNEVRDAQRTLHKTTGIAFKAMGRLHDVQGLDVAEFTLHANSVDALIKRVAWLYERFLELEAELANAYAIIDGDNEDDDGDAGG